MQILEANSQNAVRVRSILERPFLQQLNLTVFRLNLQDKPSLNADTERERERDIDAQHKYMV